MATTALLAKTPNPTDADIDAAITNLCRCGTYPAMRAAIKRAANSRNQGGLIMADISTTTAASPAKDLEGPRAF